LLFKFVFSSYTVLVLLVPITSLALLLSLIYRPLIELARWSKIGWARVFIHSDFKIKLSYFS